MYHRWILIWLVVLLVLVGIIGRSGSIVALSLPLLIYIGAALLLSPNQSHLDIHRYQNSDFVNTGTPVQIKISVMNRGRFLPEVLIQDAVPHEVEITSGKAGIRTLISSGEELDFDYEIISRRGFHKFTQVMVTSSDPFGLFPQLAPVVVYSQLTTFPAVKKLHPIRIQPQETRPYPGPIRSRKGGSGTDFYGIRDYEAGDPMRWVNWQATSRHAEELFTNQFELENIADVGLIVDARPHTDIQDLSVSLFEHSIRITASLADAFLNAGNRVSLLVYGYGMDRVFPGYGKAQRERILRLLAQVRTGHNYPLESLNYLPTRLFPARSQLVMISPLSRHDTPHLIRLRASGYDLLIISPDPVDYQARTLGGEAHIEEAARLAQIERNLLLKKLAKAGIPVVNWNVDQSADNAIQKVTRQPIFVRRPVRWKR
jgi:uncharacterized protein (DUF58 family)